MTSNEAKEFVNENLSLYKSKRKKQVLLNVTKYIAFPLALNGIFQYFNFKDASIYDYVLLSAPPICFIDGLMFICTDLNDTKHNYKEVIEELKRIKLNLESGVNSFERLTIEEANNHLIYKLKK